MGGRSRRRPRTALDAVADAERDGFEVHENYSVRETREAKTQAQYDERLAQAHSNFIRHQVGALVGNESRINGELQAMTAEWGTDRWTPMIARVRDELIAAGLAAETIDEFMALCARPDVYDIPQVMLTTVAIKPRRT